MIDGIAAARAAGLAVKINKVALKDFNENDIVPMLEWRMAGSRTRVGFISPLTTNFYDGCNRMRLTTERKLYTCLGHDDCRDLKAALRSGGISKLDAAITHALATKPRRHDFRIGAGGIPAVARHMSTTGG